MSNKVNSIKVENDALLKPAYRAKELVGRIIEITDVEFVEGEMGEYVSCVISGDGLDSSKGFITGAQNILARLHAAADQNLFPISATVVKYGNAYDIE